MGFHSTNSRLASPGRLFQPFHPKTRLEMSSRCEESLSCEELDANIWTAKDEQLDRIGNSAEMTSEMGQDAGMAEQVDDAGDAAKAAGLKIGESNAEHQKLRSGFHE